MKVSLSPDTQGLEQNTSYPPQIWNGLAQVSQEPLIVIIVVIWILRHLFTSSGLAKISAIFPVYSSLHCFITAKLPVTIWMQRRHHSTICFGFHEASSPLSGMFRSVTAFWCSPTGGQTIRRSARSHAYPKRNSRPFQVPQHDLKPSFQIIVPQNRCILRDIVFVITNN